jgi:hypothetical protein
MQMRHQRQQDNARKKDNTISRTAHGCLKRPENIV